MGLFDRITQLVDDARRLAQEALAALDALAEEARRSIREAYEDLVRWLNSLIDDLVKVLTEKASVMKTYLNSLMPDLNALFKKVVDEVVRIATAAAQKGADIMDSINGAVAYALGQVRETLNAMIDTVNEYLIWAETALFDLLKSITPQWAQWAVDKVKQAAGWALSGVKTVSESVKDGISSGLRWIEREVRSLVAGAEKVMGYLWVFIKEVWKVFFSEEPEHCHVASLWFKERMLRMESEFLRKRSAIPVKAIVQRRDVLELMPPDKDSWKSRLASFFDQRGVDWHDHHDIILQELEKVHDVKPGHLFSVTWDEVLVDPLGGQQRLQISIQYFRWRTEGFRAISAGFLGVLAMVSALDKGGAPYEPPRLQMTPKESEAEETMIESLYKDMKPHLVLGSSADSLSQGVTTRASEEVKYRQLKFKGDDGVWRTVS